MFKKLIRGFTSQKLKVEGSFNEVDLALSETGTETLSNENTCLSSSIENVNIDFMEFVNKHRDFSSIAMEDLEIAFQVLRKRCPRTWKQNYEIRAKELHHMFMILRDGDAVKYIDPEKFSSLNVIQLENSKKITAKILMLAPKIWSMLTRESCLEFREVLRHFTVYIPFEGRPFIRAWLEALQPCLSRWILLSDSGDKTAILTLNHFLASFGQPGIVVCLEDKGKSMLQALKDAARSVEARTRGKAERYYWKRLSESRCGGNSDWQKLAEIQSKEVQLSQLDMLPRDWLVDAGDWLHVFAKVVAPEISQSFERVVKNILSEGVRFKTFMGPPKTLSRSLMKCKQYMEDFQKASDAKRWCHFGEKFQHVFGRPPTHPSDFVWNLMDIARCGIIVPTAGDLLTVKRIMERRFRVVGLKNGYSSSFQFSESGYRDLTLYVSVDFENLNLQNIPRMRRKTKIICEIQILCEAWVSAKLNTSISYNVIRSNTMNDLLTNASNYLEISSYKNPVNQVTATNILKNGWMNLVKSTDFSLVDEDNLLLQAAQKGWSVSGISILVKILQADIETKDKHGYTPLMWASINGNDDALMRLLSLGSNVNARSNFKTTALHLASENGHEYCVRILIAARSDVDAIDMTGKTPSEYNRHSRGMNSLSRGNSFQSFTKQSNLLDKKSPIEEVRAAAEQGSLLNYFDEHNVMLTVVSEMLATREVAGTIKNVLQSIWLGGDLEHIDEIGYTPLLYASRYGSLGALNVLLEFDAEVDVRSSAGETPLVIAARYGNKAMVKSLVKFRADVNISTHERVTALHVAAQYGSKGMVSLLIQAGADISAKTNTGVKVLALAPVNSHCRKIPREGIPD